MPLNEKEQAFIDSIKNKIKTYKIKTDIKEAVANASGCIIETTYSDGTKEYIDAGIEWFICSKSPYYFIDKYCYISVPNLGVIPFKLYYFQQEVMKEIFEYKKYVFLKTRQCGISTVTSFYCLWRCLFRNGEDIAIVSKRKDAAQDFITKMKITLDYLPEFLNQKIEYDNMSNIAFKNNSRIKSEARSPNAGRSGTLSLLVLDEMAFYGSDKMVRDIIASATPTLSRTGGSVIMISTPNGMSGSGAYYFEQVQSIKARGNSRTEKLVEIDWYEVPDIAGVYPQKGYNEVLLKYISMDYFNNPLARKEMRNFFAPIQEKWKENEWLLSQYNSLQETLFKQEILHDFVIMGSSVFNTDILDAVLKKTKEPVTRNILGKSSYEGLWTWKSPMPGHRYIITADIASGTGADNTAIQVFDVGEYEQVAEFYGHITTPNCAMLIKKLANYYNQGYVVVESNSIGEAVFNQLYYDEYESYRNVFKQEKTKNGITRMTGWITTEPTRKLIVNELIDWLSVDELFEQLKIYSTRFHNELTTWIWEKGKAIHSGCVSGDTIITCKNGFKEIKDVQEGEEVLTHLGNFKKVIKTMKFKDERKQMLKVKAWGFEELNITSNQEFFVFNKKKEKEFKSFEHIYNFKDVSATTIYSDEVVPYTGDFPLDDMMLFFIGHVLADGTVLAKGQIVITSSMEESDYLFPKYIEYFKDKVEVCKIHNVKGVTTYRRLYIRDKKLYDWLSSIGVSQDKDIIECLRYIEPEKQKIIYYGYVFGDGHFSKTDGRKFKLQTNSISFKLSYFMASILYRNKIKFNLCSCHCHRYERKNSKQWYINILGSDIFKILDNEYFNDILSVKTNFKQYINNADGELKIEKNRKYWDKYIVGSFHRVEEIKWDDYYYDLTVEDDHSYIANGFCVHNSAHDDSLIAMALALYLRNKATASGVSFMIDEKGNMISADRDDGTKADEGLYGVLMAGIENPEDMIQNRYGMDVDTYRWLSKG